ncbi:SDR family NAD(P)-dependent oxidoreductase [Streptomyces sp. NBC_01439]|uniref:SDR family NAD(P)-dependent oxidoreductase n=1 Tax=Streptomyces sp. NBC_01439 TaxID=2903867 RepID=UPI002E27E13F|nr:SDR family NAD(P)-dependent oxidoreductase [Streptomyces sp. NBC_01439]
MSFLDLILTAIDRQADETAVTDVDGAISYRRLGELSAELAADLAKVSRSFEPVVIDMPRSVGLVVAAVAVWRSGRGCVPFDRSQPERRAETILADAGARYVIRQVQPPGGIPRFVCEPLPVTLRHQLSGDRAHELAYVLHTSGSTGEPKGVEMGRGPLTGLLDWHLSAEDRTGDARTAQSAAVTFDVAWQEIITSLAFGGTLHIVPDEIRRDPVRLLDYVAGAGITRLFLPTAFLQTVADSGRRRPASPTIEQVFVAGSQLRVTPEIRAWFTRLGGARLHNQYGPTETHVVTSHLLDSDASRWPDLPPIGRPLPHVATRLVDASGTDVSDGEEGELLLGGNCLARGYRQRPRLTAERFTEHGGRRWYRTGDRAVLRDGLFRFTGRTDRQVKIDGHRVEPDEVEALLVQHPDVQDAHVTALPTPSGRLRLVAHVRPRPATDGPRPARVTNDERVPGVRTPGVRVVEPPWREYLAARLPAPSVPSVWFRVEAIPLNAHGKVDAARLPEVTPDRPPLQVAYSAPRTPSERLITRIWEEQLELTGIGSTDNFFDLGGTSLLAAAAAGKISASSGVEVTVLEAYAHPTVRALAGHLDSRCRPRDRVEPPRRASGGASEPVAVVGLACRFPGARTIAELWSNLLSGQESITRLDTRPQASGRLRAGGVLHDIEDFDAGYFGIPPQQASLLDPQQRLFLECCEEALEDAACVPGPDLSVGVYAGSGPSTYLLNNLLPQLGVRSLTSSVDDFNVLLANDKEFLAGRAAYALDLRGPSVNVNAACATALYALHTAVQALRSGTCDVALAGAASVAVPQLSGYLYGESMPFSPDGRCRPFDQRSAGTVFGNGVSVVALKPLKAALAAGDDIYAVIRGTGISNDGAEKAGMTAPSVAGQERAIRMALEAAAVPPASIQYVEAHGTATPVGDAMEVEALRRAYGALPTDSCWIGSIKGNVGHLGWASGMAGFLKTVLVLRHGKIPPTVHFRRANRELRLDGGPFRVAGRLHPLPTGAEPARSAVSAFGIGGFNAHVILEEAPRRAPARPEPRHWYVLPFSSRTADGMERVLNAHQDPSLGAVPLPDLARTLGTGRRHHARRTAVVAAAADSVAREIGRKSGPPVPRPGSGAVVGLFGGHGTERRGTGRQLYESEPVFRSALDEFDGVVDAEIGQTLGRLLYDPERQDTAIHDVVEVHAVTFGVQLALFRLMESKGVRFDILLGHSLGHYVAACAAGVFSAEEGMYVAIERGRAIESTDPSGTMAAVMGDVETVRRLIAKSGLQVDVAAVNSAQKTVVSGRKADLTRFTGVAAAHGTDVRALGSLRAGHSRWMRPAVDRLMKAFDRIGLCPPDRTLIGTVQGEAGVDADVTEPAYWARHLCETVDFASGLARTLTEGAGPFVELSGSSGLLSLACEALPDHPGPWIPVLRRGGDAAHDLARALAAAYEAGVDLDWDAVNGGGGRPAHLPPYPFERRRHWIGAPAVHDGGPTGDSTVREPVFEIRWVPQAVRSRSLAPDHPGAARPDGSPGTATRTTPPPDATAHGRDLVMTFEASTPQEAADPIEALRPDVTRVLDVVHELTAGNTVGRPPRLWIVTHGAQHVSADDVVSPSQRALWGLGRVVALEQPQLRTTLVDLPATPSARDLRALDACLAEGGADRELAIRDGAALSARLTPAAHRTPRRARIRSDRTYLITGGLTGAGLWTAEVLARAGARHLLLIGRRPAAGPAAERIAHLVAAGVAVETAQVDVADAVAVDRLFAARRLSRHPIGGVVHSAGALDDRLVEKTDWSKVAVVLDAKVRGSWNLHVSAAQHEAPLDFFALYSSATAVHGNYGQAAYATANAFLDGLALLRSARGLPGVSFAWGVLGEVGRVSDDAGLKDSLRQRGLGSLTAPEAESVLMSRLDAAIPEVLVLPNDWDVFLAAHELRDSTLYAGLGAGPTSPPGRGPDPDRSLEARLREVPVAERRDVLVRGIAERVGRYAEVPQSFGPDDPLELLGLDSLSLIQLRNGLQREFTAPLPPRLLVSHPTIAGITEFLLGTLAEPAPEQPSSSPEPPLSLEQRRWLSLIRGTGYGHRVVPVIFHDELDRAALLEALRTVVARHDVLRQHYPEGRSTVISSVAEVMPSEADLFRDLSGTSERDRRAVVSDELASLASGVPDPTLRPSWRLRCLDLPDGRFVLIVAGNHLEFDGAGLSVFVNEVRQTYWELRNGRTPPALRVPLQYGHYARTQADYLARSSDGARQYFSGLFSGVQGPTWLPGTGPGRATAAHPSTRYTPEEPLADLEELRAAARALGAAPFSLVLSTYASLAAEVTGLPTVCVSVIRSSRVDEQHAATIGPFTMPFPLPVHVRGWGAPQLAGQVDGTLATLSTHAQYPATELLETTRAFRGLPLDTYFGDFGVNYTSYRREHQVDGPEVEVVEVIGKVEEPLLRGHDFGTLRRIPGLHLVIADEGPHLVGHYWHHAHRVPRATVEQWARRHRALTASLLRACTEESRDAASH